LKSNDFMRTLALVTVVTGALATLVGALGMNFDAAFIHTNDVGFWIAVTAKTTVTVVAIGLARWRGSDT